MIGPTEFLAICIDIGFAMMSLAFFVLLYRIAVGPTIPDRILALDMMVAIAIGFIAIFGIFVGYYIYVDIAIALGLVGFLSTVALARFVLARGRPQEVDMVEGPAIESPKRHQEAADG